MATANMAVKSEGKKEKPVRTEWPTWTLVKLRMMMQNQLCASVPANESTMMAWLQSRMPKAKPPGGKSIEEIQREVIATLAKRPLEPEEEYEMAMNVFQRVDGKLVMGGRTIRAHIKDMARKVGALMGKLEGERAYSTRIINTVYPSEEWITIAHPDGTPFTEATGTREKFVHSWTPRGPISAIKVFEFVEGAQLNLTIKIFGNSVKYQDLETLFMYGGTHGYAGERGDGQGKYSFELEQF
jgi:hypothetical protein